MLNPAIAFKISDKMEELSPVFIVGAGRSGTSILYRIIQNHPVFAPKKCKKETKVDLTESSPTTLLKVISLMY